MKVLVTGGARSGKSSFAERYAATLAPEGLYVATAHAYDEEMKARIGLHRQEREERGFSWTTAEAPYALAETLRQADAPVVLVDCLTLWLSNWLLRFEGTAPAIGCWKGRSGSWLKLSGSWIGLSCLSRTKSAAGLCPKISWDGYSAICPVV